MHTEGVDEQVDHLGESNWLIRSECRQCGLRVGTLAAADKAIGLMDRLMWSDDALHALDRLPPWIAHLIRRDAEGFARMKGQRVITFALLNESRSGATVSWAGSP